MGSGSAVMLLQKNDKIQGLKWCILGHTKAQISRGFFGVGDTEGRAPLPLDQLLMGCIIKLG